MQTIQAVERAFGLLEIVAREPDKDLVLREIVGEAKLKASTCSRLLATLVELGYVEQRNYKGGYRLGPMAYGLSAMGPYRRDLVEIAEPHMKELADSLNVHCTLVAMCGGRRYTLCDVAANHPVNLHLAAQVSGWNDTYAYPSGRVLLAHLSEKALRTWLERMGLPGEEWPEVNSEKELRDELRAIYRKGISINRDPVGFASLAVPVREGDACAAALGVYLVNAAFTRERRKKIMMALQGAAKAMSEELYR